jgi:ABC-type transport system involved in multi-copper enzyme maturation permease subunit
MRVYLQCGAISAAVVLRLLLHIDWLLLLIATITALGRTAISLLRRAAVATTVARLTAITLLRVSTLLLSLLLHLSREELQNTALLLFPRSDIALPNGYHLPTTRVQSYGSKFTLR